MNTRRGGASGVLVSILVLAACAAPGPPPKELVEARLALQDAKAAEADHRATRTYDSAAAHLDVANKSWEKDHEAAAILHSARLAEAEARNAQYAAEAQVAEDAIRRETTRKTRQEMALRDAENLLLRQKGQEAELDRMRALAQEQEKRALAAEQARAEAEAVRLREEQEKLAALAAEQARVEQAERELARLRAEHAQARAELTATLSRLAKVREDARGVIVTLPGNIYFNVNKADVKPAMHRQLTQIAQALAAVPDQRLLIEGHTDSDGSNEYNLSLSEARAHSVRQILLAGGIAADRMAIKGYGESKPIADNDTPAGKAQNRRVELVLVPTKQ